MRVVLTLVGFDEDPLVGGDDDEEEDIITPLRPGIKRLDVEPRDGLDIAADEEDEEERVSNEPSSNIYMRQYTL